MAFHVVVEVRLAGELLHECWRELLELARSAQHDLFDRLLHVLIGTLGLVLGVALFHVILRRFLTCIFYTIKA